MSFRLSFRRPSGPDLVQPIPNLADVDPNLAGAASDSAEFGQIGPKLDQFGRNRHKLGRSRAKLDRLQAETGKVTDFGPLVEFGPMLADFKPKLAESGANLAKRFPTRATCGQARSKLGRIWPSPGRSCRTWRVRPTSNEVGHTMRLMSGPTARLSPGQHWLGSLHIGRNLVNIGPTLARLGRFPAGCANWGPSTESAKTGQHPENARGAGPRTLIDQRCEEPESGMQGPGRQLGGLVSNNGGRRRSASRGSIHSGCSRTL